MQQNFGSPALSIHPEALTRVLDGVRYTLIN